MNDIIAVQLRRGRSLDTLMREYRVAVLSEALAISNQHRGKAAELLGIHPNTLQYHIRGLRREFGIRRVK